MTGANRKDLAAIDRERVAAVADFANRYGDLKLAPITVVIPAFNEEESIAEVLRAIPAEVHGLAVDTVVVDDGSSDGTGEVVRRFDKVYLARLATNCGQGAAFRVGYDVAAAHGADYICTLDADMQWDPAEMPIVTEPLLSGEGDFILGSRVLGAAETDDAVRSAGVKVFGTLVSLLTGVKVTDTSSGWRAFRTEVGQRVPQVQPQYQSSELLIGAIYQGYRIAERPIIMHKRFAGESKKGRNVWYGARYARVLITTWWRERARAKREGRPVRY